MRPKLGYCAVAACLLVLQMHSVSIGADPAPKLAPLDNNKMPVDWLFIFKFNAESFPGCGGPATGTDCAFGGQVQDYSKGHSQQYVFATSKDPALVKGTGCIGAGSDGDPLGATFRQVYDRPSCYYVLWNDQFYGDPIDSHSSPWGHSKGMVAWDEDGDGFALQVSTPSWPASGSKEHKRQTDGNTLGCITDDDVLVSQHFFAIRINKADLLQVLDALANASVVTDVDRPEIVRNGGPDDVQERVKDLGKHSPSEECTTCTLSSGIRLISKPSKLALPPWQLVSAKLDGLPLRVATWWTNPTIPTTLPGVQIDNWPVGLTNPGRVEIAASGRWEATEFGLKGGLGKNFNHAKVGVSLIRQKPICIFGDLNQQGALRGNMKRSQNGRGGTFYILENPQLYASLARLLHGDTAAGEEPNGH